jgi:hypothetical protein
MTKEDIIRMAREAGFCREHINTWMCTGEDIKNFAVLVAAEEREAMVAEAAKKGWAMRGEDPFEDCVREIAEIRARGQA